MKIGKIVVTENRIEVLPALPPWLLTSGLAGATVDINFDESWDGLSKTLVWRGSGVTVDDTECTGIAPPEVLAKPNGNLFVGVYGTAENRVIPTVWADLGHIFDGAKPSCDPTTDPALPVWAQILNKIGSLEELSTEAKDSLVAAINEAAQSGGGGGASGEPGQPGKDGYTPVKGVDYYTEADKQEMVAAVIAALPVYDGEVAEE